MKLGDYVDFKRDIEGSGYIKEIIRTENYFGGDTVTYIVAYTPDQSIKESSWHQEARYSEKHNDYVVYLDESELY